MGHSKERKVKEKQESEYLRLAALPGTEASQTELARVFPMARMTAAASGVQSSSIRERIREI